MSLGYLAERTKKKSSAKWRKVGNLLRKKTITGVTVIGGDGEAGIDQHFYRYSEGAAKLEASGVRMIPVQGTNGPAIRLRNAIKITQGRNKKKEHPNLQKEQKRKEQKGRNKKGHQEQKGTIPKIENEEKRDTQTC